MRAARVSASITFEIPYGLGLAPPHRRAVSSRRSHARNISFFRQRGRLSRPLHSFSQFLFTDLSRRERFMYVLRGTLFHVSLLTEVLIGF